ncbi:hypothetical protein G7084_00605 [Weissella coleopterorum]|uniref:Uncharacterized protein n=1 Tax=Weissella coleopterorum TaxID=2714949 RepID=A0A6G8AY22_9LACO|nr:hypothetical protein [Weissella coleopterorum]QIL49954.1 hypothetical protein G7084_00605 [Weissella coleopterorum]
MLKKILVGFTSLLVIVGIASGSYYLGNSRKEDASKKVSSAQTSEKKDRSKKSSYSVGSKFKPSGEMGQAVADQSSLMTSKTGVPITEDNIKDAREQLQQQGIDDGAFSDLDIAKVIDKANSDSLDLKSAVKAIYPHYFD